MISWSGNDNKTMTGTMNPQGDRIKLFTDKYPLKTEGETFPFLLTRDTIFDFQGILEYIKEKVHEREFKELKNAIANILIIPGLVVSIMYLVRYVGSFERIVILETFFESPIINIFFWLALLGVMILWHDHFSTSSPFTKLPSVPYFPDTEWEEIKMNGINMNRFGRISAFKYISEDVKEILERTKKEVDVKEIMKTLLLRVEIIEVLNRAGLNKDGLENINFENIPKSSLEHILTYSLEEALITQSPQILPVHLFLCLVKTFPKLEKEVEKQNSSLNVLREITSFLVEVANKMKVNCLNPFTPYYSTGGFAKNWVYGYTSIISHFSRDINEEVAQTTEVYGIGHEKEVEELISTLSRATRRNALLIGESGVGKSSLIMCIAQRINRGDVPPQLFGHRIVQLDINGLISYISKKKKTEKIINKAVQELTKAGNVILFIDELSRLVPAVAQEEGSSISQVFFPYIEQGLFPLVGTVNYDDYKKHFYTSESFRQSFNNIEILELPARDTLKILESKIPMLEKIFKIYITFPALISTVEYAQRYIHDKMLPNSATTLLEDACSWGSNNGVKVLTSDHIAKVVSLNTNTSVEIILNKEAEKLISLEEKIMEQVIGQDEAVQIVSEQLRNINSQEGKPLAIFLFAGPMGSGKAYFSKVISREYFNNQRDPVRVNIEEYKEVEEEYLSKVRIDPYSTILFEDIDKADEETIERLATLFKQGSLTDSKGEIIDFSNSIIICTTSITADVIIELVSSRRMWEEVKDIASMKLKENIHPEIFSLFSSIIIFKPQTMDSLSKIADMILEELRVNLKEKDIDLDWDSTIPMLIANKAYDKSLGSTAIKRYIQDKIEGNIAKEVIDGNVKKGEGIKIKESWIV